MAPCTARYKLMVTTLILLTHSTVEFLQFNTLALTELKYVGINHGDQWGFFQFEISVNVLALFALFEHICS